MFEEIKSELSPREAFANKYGFSIRDAIIMKMDKLEVADGFVVPIELFTYNAVRARVCEFSKSRFPDKRFKTTLKEKGTAIYRVR